MGAVVVRRSAATGKLLNQASRSVQATIQAIRSHRSRKTLLTGRCLNSSAVASSLDVWIRAVEQGLAFHVRQGPSVLGQTTRTATVAGAEPLTASRALDGDQ